MLHIYLIISVITFVVYSRQLYLHCGAYTTGDFLVSLTFGFTPVLNIFVLASLIWTGFMRFMGKVVKAPRFNNFIDKIFDGAIRILSITLFKRK